MCKKILVVLADGFEEIEAVAPVDIWRRIGFEVILAGLSGLNVTGAHGITIAADITLENCVTSDIDALFLPGGMPGSKNLKSSLSLKTVIQELASRDDVLITAICAAPIVLHNAGVIDNKRVTCYPGFDKELTASDYTGKMIEKDGDVITGKGPGAAADFAFTVARALGADTEASQFEKGMLFK